MKHPEVICAQDGYHVDSRGLVFSPYGKQLRLCKGNQYGHLVFNLWHRHHRIKVYVHRLAAFQKFGEALLVPGIETRHLDGNAQNNSMENIAIGTHAQNVRDIPAEQIKARMTRIRRKRCSPEMEGQILEDRHSGMLWRELGRKYNVAVPTIRGIVKRLESEAPDDAKP